MAEEREGELVDYVFAGDRRVARLGGKKPVPVAAGVMRWLGAVHVRDGIIQTAFPL